MFAAPQQRPSQRSPAPPPAPDASRTRVQRAADPAAAWRRLATAVPVSRPGDAAEREADGVADALVRGESARVAQVGPGVGPGRGVQRRCAACEEEQRTEEGGAQVQRKPGSGPGPDAEGAPSRPIASGGTPLSPGLRAYFEPRLGADLGAVRLHTGAESVASARRFAARAYTYGSHVVFGAEGLDPGSDSGRHLLAHELVHTVQQAGGGAAGVQREPDKEKRHDWTEDWWPPHFKPIFPDSPIEPPGTKDLVDGCQKAPWLPGCTQVCKVWGCNPAPSSKTLCLPGYHGSTSSGFKDQCCRDGQPDSAENCCPKERMGDGGCCAEGEAPVAGHCTKVTPGEPGRLCPPPGRTALSGDCCFPPKVPGVWGCEDEQKVEPPKPVVFDTFVDRFTVLFKQDQPRAGQGLAEALSAGRGEIDEAIAALKKDLSTGAQLVANASQEGEPGYNLDLTDRRLAAVRAEMAEVAWKVRDPIPPLANTAGCRGSWGAYSCGAKDADTKAQLPGDRNLIIRLFRPTEIKPLPTSPQSPTAPPSP